MDSAEGIGTSSWLKPQSKNQGEYDEKKYSFRTRLIIVVVGSLLGWGIVFLPIVAFSHDYHLDKTEFGAEYLPRFQKWSGVLQRHRNPGIAIGRPCAGGTEGTCTGPTWSAFLDQLKTEALAEQISRVNRYVNGAGYQPDAANWGESDRWSAPAEFFARGGDCEDYAIAKYFLLRELGVAPERLSIVVLHDRQRRQTHAVLAVTWDHRTLVLDNLRDRIVPWRELDHYLPIYALNEQSAWLYTRAEILLTQRPGG